MLRLFDDMANMSKLEAGDDAVRKEHREGVCNCRKPSKPLWDMLAHKKITQFISKCDATGMDKKI